MPSGAQEATSTRTNTRQRAWWQRRRRCRTRESHGVGTPEPAPEGEDDGEELTTPVKTGLTAKTQDQAKSSHDLEAWRNDPKNWQGDERYDSTPGSDCPNIAVCPPSASPLSCRPPCPSAPLPLTAGGAGRPRLVASPCCRLPVQRCARLPAAILPSSTDTLASGSVGTARGVCCGWVGVSVVAVGATRLGATRLGVVSYQLQVKWPVALFPIAPYGMPRCWLQCPKRMGTTQQDNGQERAWAITDRVQLLSQMS